MADRSLLDRARASLGQGIDAIDECMARVRAMVSGQGEYDTRLASHLAFLVGYQAQALRELRLLDRHDAIIARDLSPDDADRMIGEYLAEMPADRRRGVLARFVTEEAEETI